MRAHRLRISRFIPIILVSIVIMSALAPNTHPASAETGGNSDLSDFTHDLIGVSSFEVLLSLGDNNALDYAIGKAGNLIGQAVDKAGEHLTYTWKVVAGPSGDSDHTNEIICERTSFSDVETCEISPLFFDADDMGLWTIELSVDDGSAIGKAELEIEVKGFADREHQPSAGESSVVGAIKGWIDWDSWEFKALLEHTDINGVTYLDSEGTGEDHYMQAPLNSLLQKLVPVAREEGMQVIITEAWDPPAEPNPHGEGSKHKEGRALDIVPNYNPQDVKRIGRLAYLVQKAAEKAGLGVGGNLCSNSPNGCYWVYHETDHVHVSVRGDHVGPYTWGYRCEGDMCLEHQEQSSASKSGAAVGSMLLDWINFPIGQDEFFIQAGSPSVGISCNSMASTLNSYTRVKWECNQAVDREEAMRMITFWTDWTSIYFGASFPAAIPAYGDYQHWLGIEGVIATKRPTEQTTKEYPGYGNYEVGGFYIDDPSLNMLRADAKRFEGKNGLMSSYQESSGGGFEILVATGCQTGNSNTGMVTTAKANSSSSGFCGQSVWITEPDDGGEVDVGDTVTIKVTAVFGATNVELKVDGVAQTQTFHDGISQYEYEWNVPSNATVGTRYNLQAFAIVNGIQESSDVVTLTISNGVVDPNPVSFIYPIDYQDNLIFNTEITVKVDAPNAEFVELQITPDEFGFDGNMKKGASGYWESTWTPKDFHDDGTETYFLRALAFLPDNGGSNDASITVYGRPEDLDEENPTVRFLNLTQNLVLTAFTPIRVSATDNDGISYVGLGIESFGKTEILEEYISCGSGCYEFDWTPNQNGRYAIDVLAYDLSGNPGAAIVDIEVDIPGLPERSDTLRINQFAFLRYIKNLDYDRQWYGMKNIMYDTGIQSKNYVCSVAGFSARDGDIGEEWDSQIIRVYLTTDATNEDSTWRLMADFNTFHRTWTGTFGGDRYETWDVTLLCIDKEVASFDGPQPGKHVFIKSTPRMGDNVGSKVHYDTGYRIDEYACGIAGFDSGKGDINEKGDGDIIHTNLYRKNDTWWVRADFRTHNNNEDWRVDVLCTSREWASLDSSQAGHPFVLKQYKKLGDNIHYPTEFAVEDWACTAVGFAAKDGDINEDGYGDIIKTYLEPKNGVWYIRADFRTHKDDENWDVNVLCLHKDLSEAPEMLSATATLFEGRASDNWLYGPGMHLEWTETYHPEAAYYKIEYSEDGGTTWHIYNDKRPISHGGWINHHSNLRCGHGFGHCLKRNQEYSYRVRVLDAAQQPINDWSHVITATSMDWPAHVELAEPSPPGPYGRNATVTLQVENSYGKDLWLEWNLRAYGGASYSIQSGCQSGYLYDAHAKTCVISIHKGSNAYAPLGRGKLAMLAPPASVEVMITGTDSLGDGYTDWDERTLHFRKDDPPETSFEDVPQSH